VGVRALEARLTRRFIALATTVLIALGVWSVAVTQRVLDRSDTELARARAVGALDVLDRELGEGHSLEEALHEVLTANGDACRLAVRRDRLVAGRETLPMLAPGTCTTLFDAAESRPEDTDDERAAQEKREPWRACAAERGSALVVAEVPIASHEAVVGALWRYMLVAIGLAVFATWIAVRRAVADPVRELSALVEWTAHVADEESTVAAPAGQTREIVRLASAFDGLIRRLLDALARERASSAHIAHELRTPLTAIVIELEALARRDPAAREVVARVLGDVARFGDAIESILVLSSRALGQGLEQPIVNLADIARELVPPGALVEAPEEALVEADERLVRLALRNLIDNASKYGFGARVIRVTRFETTARLCVVDCGPGADAEARLRMFDRYWRASADGEGRGLGLALVRAVAERYGGTAEALPGVDGKGLEVSMTIAPVVGWHERESSGAR
jgi:signal transduction histidine kinase